MKQSNPKTYTSPKEIIRDAKARLRARRKMRLIRAGLTEKQIKELEENERIRTILCLSYGTYTVENGTKSKKVTKRDEHHKPIGKEEIQVPNILHGTEAIAFTLEKNKFTVIARGAQYIYVKTTEDKIEEVTKLMNPMGRIYIQEWTPSVETKPKGKKKKNTTKVKMTRSEWRAYYSAVRNGGVSKRVKKFNPLLAKKIKTKMNEPKNDQQLTSLQRKANKKARKIAKTIATKQRVIAMDKKRATRNITKVHKKPVELELKMAA